MMALHIFQLIIAAVAVRDRVYIFTVPFLCADIVVRRINFNFNVENWKKKLTEFCN